MGRAVIQLAAVLGIICVLRQIEGQQDWRRTRFKLVNRDDEWRLFKSAVVAVIWGDNGLAQRAIDEADGEPFQELSFAVGLLAWLAWDVGLGVADIEQRRGLQATEDERLSRFQLLAALGIWLAKDEGARQELESSVARTPRSTGDGDRWLRSCHAVAEVFAQVTAEPDRHGERGRPPRPGDLVVLNSRYSPRVRVVLKVQPSGDGQRADSIVVCFDPANAKEESAFLSSCVATLPWPVEASPRD